MIKSVLIKVFQNTRYLALALATSFFVLSSIVLLPNREIIIQLISASAIGVGEKLFFVSSLYGSLVLNYGVVSITYILGVSVLFGINIALLTYYVRRRQSQTKGKTAHVTSLAGLVSGIFGIGCAACGSIILTSVLGLFGAGGLILFLPFNGSEFGFIGLFLLGYSIYYLIKRINDPLVCLLD